jgi:hypothetical protein
VRQSAATPG